MRSDCRPQGTLCEKGLPGKTPAYPVLRFKEQQNVCVSHQQLHPASHNHCRSVSLSLAGETVFQMHQATSQNQGFLRHYRKCRQNPDMDRYLRLCSRGHRKKNLEPRSESLHNSTGSQCHAFRENAHFAGTFVYHLHKSRDPSQQPTEFIRLTLGQQ